MFVFLMSQCKLIEIDNANLQNRIASLNQYLAKHFHIPQDHQILLTDGGCELKELHEIENHSAGENSTNPIYVFSRENTITPDVCSLKAPPVALNLVAQFQNPTESALTSVRKRVEALIASVKEDGQMVQRLDQEQRLMCQGWFVALANFELSLQECRQEVDTYWRDYGHFCCEVGRWEANLNKFPSIKERLRSVPLLASLVSPSELTSVINSAPPLTLYDWVCLQIARTSPRRPNASNHVGILGSGCRLSSATTSSLDVSIPLAALRNVPPPLHLQSKLASIASFYLSTSPSTSQLEGGSDEGSAVIIPSLETPLLEMVENSSYQLKVMQDRSLGAARSQHLTGSDDNSLLMMGVDEEAEVMDSSSEMRLNYAFSLLKAFDDFLQSVPRDPEVSTEDEAEEECEVGKQRVSSTPAIFISAAGPAVGTKSFALVSASSWPLPEEEEGTTTANVEKTTSTHSTVRELSWKLSRRNFSCHLEKLSRLRDQAVQSQQLIVQMAEQFLLNFQTDKIDKQRTQNQRLVAMGTFCENLQVNFDRILQLKIDLAKAISTLQEQLKTLSSEMISKHRECLRCNKFLGSISKSSALLDQLQDAPELYIKCLLEIVRRRRMLTTWSNLNDRYARQLARFQHSEMRQRETVALALNNHLLADIFRPLNSHLRPPRQYSLIPNTAASSSVKRLNSVSKCLSASHLNFNAPPSAFRLLTNRAPEARVCPPLSETIDTSARSPEATLPAVTEAEMRNLASQLPTDLAEMILEALTKLEADEEEVAASLLFDSKETEDVQRPSQLNKRTRLISSPGALALSHWQQQQNVDVSTSTADGPNRVVGSATSFLTEDKAVSVAMEPEFPLGFYDSRLSLHPDSLPCLTQQQQQPEPEQSSDVYLSMESSQLVDEAGFAGLSIASQQPNSLFYSLQGSIGNSSSSSRSDSTTSSIVAPPPSPRVQELLGVHDHYFRRLLEQLNSHLPSPLSFAWPKFSAGDQEVENYLQETVACLGQLVNHMEAFKVESDSSGSAPISPVNAPATDFVSVGVQTLQIALEVSTECHFQDFVLPQAPSILAAPVAPISGDAVPFAALRDDLIPRAPRVDCVFSNFRCEDVVIFIPMTGLGTPAQQAESNDALSGDAELKRARGVSPRSSHSLAFLSSAIISTSLCPPPLVESDAVEQWRMLSNDNRVYFLHDDDFDAFHVSQLARLPASSAPGRASSPAGTIPESTLQLSNRAFPFVIGVYQRKEKCISKKDRNRFNLPKNFVFFRVRARPLHN